ncbi:MAG: hypothetical protein MUF15_11310, partial [Acidobacteria bacterium]|nr:hypothetical protein [Acidobacteriota bacterium]
MEINEKYQTNLEQIYKDVKKAAEIAGVAYDRHVVQDVLEAYKDFFSHSPVTFATNTQPLKERKLSVRYADLQVPHDPFQTALEKGFLNAGSHPIYELLTEIRPEVVAISLKWFLYIARVIDMSQIIKAYAAA